MNPPGNVVLVLVSLTDMFTYCIYRNSSIYIKVHLFYIYNVAAYQIWIKSCSTQQPGHLLKIARKSLFIVLHYLRSTCSLHKMEKAIWGTDPKSWSQKITLGGTSMISKMWLSIDLVDHWEIAFVDDFQSVSRAQWHQPYFLPIRSLSTNTVKEKVHSYNGASRLLGPTFCAD